MNTFAIKFLDFSYDPFSDFDSLFKQSVEKFGMAIATILKNGFLKFNNHVADFLLNNQIFSYFRKYFAECSSGYTPGSRRLLILFGWYIGYGPTESLNEPTQNNDSGISNFNRNTVDIVRFVFGLPFLNSKASFGVYETSHIRVIDICRNYCIFNIIERFYLFSGDKMHGSFLSNIFNKIVSFTSKRFSNNSKIVATYKLSKLYEYLGLRFFINKISEYLLTNSYRTLAFDSPAICISMSRFKWFFSDETTEEFLETFKNFDFYRNYLNRIFIYNYVFWLLDCLSKIKASITIDIPSGIRQHFINFLHTFDTTGKLKRSQDPQRLSGRDIDKFDVCDSPNLYESIGGGINKTSRHENGQ